MRRKNNKGIICMFILLIMLVIFLISLVVYKGFFVDKNSVDKNVETTISSTTTALKDKDNNQKYDYEIGFDNCENCSDEAKIYFPLVANISQIDGLKKLIEDNRTVITYNDLSQDFKENMIFIYLMQNKLLNYLGYKGGYYEYSVKKQDVNEAAKQVFGVNSFAFSRKEGSIYSSYSIIDETEDEYILDSFAYGNEGVVKYYSYISDNYDSEQYILYIVYTEYETDPNTDIILENTLLNINYKVTFKNNGNSYIFDKIELINN